METRKLSKVVRSAIAGDEASTEAVIARYMPLFNNSSKINGKYDEDLRQYILMRVIQTLPKFNPDYTK
jgi:DNA-directed RNA polymerase specialized sigma subunit